MQHRASLEFSTKMAITFNSQFQIECFKFLWVQLNKHNIVEMSEFTQQFRMLSGSLHIDNAPYRQSQMLQKLLCIKPMVCTSCLYAYFLKIIFELQVILAYQQFDCRYVGVIWHRQLFLTFLGAPNYFKCVPNLGLHFHDSTLQLLALYSISKLH